LTLEEIGAKFGDKVVVDIHNIDYSVKLPEEDKNGEKGEKNETVQVEEI
jgi:predicted dinucleotide-binding enzyme